MKKDKDKEKWLKKLACLAGFTNSAYLAQPSTTTFLSFFLSLSLPLGGLTVGGQWSAVGGQPSRECPKTERERVGGKQSRQKLAELLMPFLANGKRLPQAAWVLNIFFPVNFSFFQSDFSNFGIVFLI